MRSLALCWKRSGIGSRCRYLAAGVARRLIERKSCPCCGPTASVQVDRKFCYTLERCEGCGILFRHPRESAAEMRDFYEAEYSQRGLTTELPGDAQLAELMQSGFKGTEKDFSRVVALLGSLGLAPGAQVLDFGASWGYGTYQLCQAGYAGHGYEVSRARARLGARLGLRVVSETSELDGPYDAVYSSHVLEHVADPRETLRLQLELTRPGGFVVAHTPNGSALRRASDVQRFHLQWGQVHPCLLTDEFVGRVFASQSHYLATDEDLAAVARWMEHGGQARGALGGDELLIILRKGRDGLDCEGA